MSEQQYSSGNPVPPVDPPLADASASAASASQNAQTPSKAGSTLEKVKTGAYIAKCVIIGGAFIVGGIAVWVTQSGAWWVGLLLLAYGLWLLSGVATGGWRLFIY